MNNDDLDSIKKRYPKVDGVVVELIVNDYGSDRLDEALSVLDNLSSSSFTADNLDILDNQSISEKDDTLKRESEEEDLELFLRETFLNVEEGIIKNALEGCGGDAERAVEEVLSQLALMKQSVETFNLDTQMDNLDNDNESIIDEKLAVLMDLYPSASVDVLRQSLEKCGYSLMQAIEDLSKNSTDSLKKSTTKQQQQQMQRSLRAKHVDIEINMARKYVSNSSGGDTVTDMRMLDTRSKSSGNISGEEYRKEAAEYAQKRNEAYRKAAQAFKTGRNGRAVAAFYAEEGRRLGQEMNQSNWNAALTILEENDQQQSQEDKNCDVLDLHYLFVNEAIQILKDELLRRKQQQSRRILRVVTGKGNRSGGAERLFNACHRYLTANDYSFESGPGFFLIRR